MTSTQEPPATPVEASADSGDTPGMRATPLRRIAGHLRNQHWVAIGIEFLVVVFGVFLGFQLTSWNESRQQAEFERAMLTRLGEEFRSVEIDLADVVERFDATTRSTRLILDTLRAGVPPDDEAAFRIALRDAQYIWDAPALSTTYQEFLAIGGLSRLHDSDLRKSLARYGAIRRDMHARCPTRSQRSSRLTQASSRRLHGAPMSTTGRVRMRSSATTGPRFSM